MSKHQDPKLLKGVRLDQVTADANPGDPEQSGPATTGPASHTVAAPSATPRRRRAVIAVAALAAAFGLYEGYGYFTHGRYIYSTDDAYLKADMSIVAAKVGGYVAGVPAVENAIVKAGDTLVVIDDGDYKIAVDAARAKIATQDATIARLGKQAEAQKAAIEQARAQISSAKADVTRTSADLERTASLAKDRYASVKTLDQARADQIKAVQSVTGAEAALTAAEANLAVAIATQIEAERTKTELQSSLEKAVRDLAFATIKAPISGVVGNRAAQVGDYVQPGTRLLALVPLDHVYVEANFKETQLADMAPGQTATVTVDSLGGKTVTGVVESVSPASGSLYSLLPPENATGNFTKIVQRVPVRIALPAGAVAKGGLRAGLSVVVAVDTRSGSAVPPPAKP